MSGLRAHVPVATAAGGRAARRRRRGRTAGAVARQLAIVLVILVALYPLAFMVVTALKSQEQYIASPFGLPWPLDFGNFGAAMRGGEFFSWLKNTVLLTVASVAASTVMGAMAAFAIARLGFRGSRAFLATNMALMVVPAVVLILPLFALFVALELVASRAGVIMIYAGLTLPFAIFLLTPFFRALPDEVFEAAIMDGASTVAILRRIVVPMVLPALFTLVVVNSLWVWNELLIALVFLPSDELRTLMVGITIFQSTTNLNVPVTMAGMILSSLPMVILYLVAQRSFVRGLTGGAVKG